MTLKELSQLYYLKKEIKKYEQRLDIAQTRATRATSDPTATIITRGKSSSKEEVYAETEEEIKKCIDNLRIKCKREELKIIKYIETIPDSLTRSIFNLRFIELKTWLQVANALGGNNTEDSVKKICYRYLDTHT